MFISSPSKSLNSAVTFNISCNCLLSYTVPISSPNIQSKILLIGKDTGKVTIMKNLVIQMVCAPTAKPCLEQILWGIISPNITIPAVEPKIAAIPLPIKPSKRIVKDVFTKTLPNNNVQRR